MKATNSLLSRATGLVVSAALVISGMLLTPAPVEASAYGCSGAEPVYCVSLVGTGRFVNYVRGDFRGGAFVCNYYLTAEFFDTNWRWYQTLRTPTRNGCATGGGDSININAYRQNGYMCSTLRYYDGLNRYRTRSVCHVIRG